MIPRYEWSRRNCVREHLHINRIDGRQVRMNLGTIAYPDWQPMDIHCDGKYSGELSPYQYILTNPANNDVEMGRFPEEDIIPYLLGVDTTEIVNKYGDRNYR